MKNETVNIIFFIFTFYSLVISQSNLLTGTVIDSRTREQLIGASIFLQSEKYFASTDVNGKYKFQNLPVGTYKFIFKYLWYLDYMDSITIRETSSYIIKNIEMTYKYFSPVMFKDTVISGYYNWGFEYSGIRLCGENDETWWYLEPNETLRKIHNTLRLQVKDTVELSSYGFPEIYIIVRGKMSIQGNYIHVGNYNRTFIVNKVLEIRLSTGDDCNN